MDKTAREVFYETQRHASRPYTDKYPPRSKSNEGGKGGFLSLLSAQGLSQLKEKWGGYRQPSKVKRLSSLFVSSTGEYVAVAAGNQITILQKEDDYREPCGVFRSSGSTTFTAGSWSELHDILAVADDAGAIYFIRVNGEEITRIARRSLKALLPLVGIIVQDDPDVQRSCLCNFAVVSSDGSFHNIEIGHESSSSISSSDISHPKELSSSNIYCIDYHPHLSLFVAVGRASSLPPTGTENSETCYMCVWRKYGISDPESSFSIQFEGLYAKSKGYKGQLAYPKVLISPQGEFVVTLDVKGCLHIFKLDKECRSLYFFDWRGSHDSKGLSSFVDVAWWSDSILTLASSSGLVTMVDILSGVKVQESDVLYSSPVLDRIRGFQAHIFLLESNLSEERDCHTEERETDNSHRTAHIVEDNFNEVDYSRLRWNLISFLERSVSEMYDVFIKNQRYQTALDFANCHGLDKDEVRKSQWSCSTYGVSEVNMFLSDIKDRQFVLAECVDKVGPTEDAVKALLEHGLRLTNQYGFSESGDVTCNQIWDFRLVRLRLLQFKDRLDTYLGINMGRFSAQDYRKFRCMPINEAAVALAESGKMGALNLLFKRHPYSLTPYILEILASVPETVSIQSYSQLLPGRSPPSNVAVREEDWVECEKTVRFITGFPDDHDLSIDIKTEPIVKLCLGSFWPSADELSVWYKNRAKDIDSLSGQLSNSLSLIDFACRKGMLELQQFYEDISYLHQLVYSNDNDCNMSFSMSLVAWEQLPDYEKFKLMLKVVKEENVVAQLQDKAVPFMQKRLCVTHLTSQDHESNHVSVDNEAESFLVRWLKEISVENKIDVCLMVIEEGCRDFETNSFFKDEAEAVNCVLQCLYMYTITDKWTTMAVLLSKLLQLRDTTELVESLEKRLKLAEGHVEAGRLLALYQVPKPMKFFLEAHSDVKAVKQIIRLILSKFIRRQPGRPDNEWAALWRDMQCLREKAFPFLDMEYLLVEFCRGLLKAGKFSLARNYLKGTSSVALASEKAENIVIQAAREYFFSASSLSSPEIWKAKECLNLVPNSRNVKAEADVIDALTVNLPCLGVTLLPLEYKQIKDPMEIVKMVITSQPGAYLQVDELIEVAKLLGLNSSDEICAVEEAIAREAAVAGDIQLAFDLCLMLAKKGHGPLWDLCAAIARGPALENMDINSRKQLLGFALSHCDEESIGELLHAWKDLDMQCQCETLMMSSRTSSPNPLRQGQSATSLLDHNIQDMYDAKDWSPMIEEVGSNSEESSYEKVENMLSAVAKRFPFESEKDWQCLLRENGKLFSFASSILPWLLEASRKPEDRTSLIPGFGPGKQYISVRTQSVLTLLSWLARNGFAPRDDLIALLAKSILETPGTRGEDVIGFSFLLNLADAVFGVDIIEEQLKSRNDYQEICSIMNIGMKFSLLHNSSLECDGPAQRRELLLRSFNEKHTGDEKDNITEVQSTFWRDWKLKLEEQKRVADHSRVLEQIIPGVEPARFLDGDLSYIAEVVFSLIESVKFEKKHILRDLLKLADAYGLNQAEVLVRYLASLLVSEVWTGDDVMAEISDFKDVIVNNAAEVIKVVSSNVYPVIDGCNKQHLACIYSLLSDCYFHLEKTEVSFPKDPKAKDLWPHGIAHFYKVIADECRRVSFIKNLNFKNISGLDGLNLDGFKGEIYKHINESSLEALAKMVQTLASTYPGALPDGLMSWQGVYKHYISLLLKNLEGRAKTELKVGSPEKLQDFISQLEQTYEFCRIYIRLLEHSDALDIMKKFLTIIKPLYDHCMNIPDTSAWQECLILLLSFWIRLADEVHGSVSHESLRENLSFDPECLVICLKVFIKLVVEDSISPAQGWSTILSYICYGLSGNFQFENFIFFRSMMCSGCGFGAIAEVYSEAVTSNATDTALEDLPSLFREILEHMLRDLVNESLENQNLYNFLSSLSKLEGDLDLLKRVRNVVWERMVKFSSNLELPSHIRVHTLELMQFISGGYTKGFSAEVQSKVLPWEGWDGLHCTSGQSESATDQELSKQHESSGKFTSTLIALKSSQLAAAISPTIEVSPDDLSDVESAVSCFLKLCAAANSSSHLDNLITLLGEWEGLFVSSKDEEISDSPDAGNKWNNDDWDEGWESFQEVEALEKDKIETPQALHPLHECWIEVFRQLITYSRFRDVLRIIDQSAPKCNCTLLDENGARSLSQILLEQDCFVALKMVLLLPYKPIQLQCLGMVEDKLKQEGISNIISRDLELLTLVLASSVVSNIINDPSYGTTFSYLCYLVGNFSRRSLEAQLTTGKSRRDNSENELLLFRNILFPLFLSELVRADQQVLAGFLVTKYMHTNPSLRLINIAEASLYRYLQGQLNTVQHNQLTVEMNSHENLRNTITGLKAKLIDQIQSVIPLLSSNVR